MPYARVIPRDLFNEGDLLKCLGRLWLVLDQVPAYHATLDHVVCDRFEIVQDPSDGSISCSSIALQVRGPDHQWFRADLFRPLNSREAWPLWARIGDPLGDFDDVEVFTPSGNLSGDMERLFTTGAVA